MLRGRLNDIVIPKDVLLCRDRMCCSSDRFASLSNYARLIRLNYSHLTDKFTSSKSVWTGIANT